MDPSQVNPVKPTTIEDLPNEVLVPILETIEYKDRLTATGVSVRWNRIVDAVVGRKLFVGNPCQFTPDDEERFRHHYMEIDTIRDLGVSTCYVGEVVDPRQFLRGVPYYWNKLREYVFGEDIPTFKYPHLVKHLFFDGPIPSDFFFSMLLPLINLNRLDIHLSALSCLEESQISEIRLRHLHTLNIWGHKLTQGMFTTTYSSAKIISNLFKLLANYYPELTNFAVEFPYDAHQEIVMSRVVLNFLSRHKSTIEKFKIEINLFSGAETSTAFESAEERSLADEAKQISKSLKLKSLELIISSLFQLRLFKIWTSFGEQQTNLSSFTGLSFRFQPDILTHLCARNGHNLTHIWISRLMLVDNGRLTVIHCNIFEECHNLKSLLIEGMPLNLDQPSLISCADLPKRLEHLELGGMTIASEDAFAITQVLPVLKELNLGDAGTKNGLGMRVEDITKILADRRIDQITLYDSINGRIPTEGLHNGNTEHPKMLKVLAFGSFEVKLDEFGFYENLARDEWRPYVDDEDEM